jgi:hypothetical protein
MGRLPIVSIENGMIRPHEGQLIVKTDAKGRFSLAREPDPDGRYYAIVVVHPGFYAEVNRPAFEADSTIATRPWGRVEGVVWIGGKPAGGEEIRYYGDRLGNSGVPYISVSGNARADAEGRFVFDHVAPGDVRVARAFREGRGFRAWSNGTLIEVNPGETAHAEVGGKGRPVVARIVPPEGFDPDADYSIHSRFEIESDRPSVPKPKEAGAHRDESVTDWSNRWWASEEGYNYRRNWFRLGQAKLLPDGTIRAEDVPPGEYRLKLTYSADPIRGPNLSRERIATASKKFTIPEIPGGHTDEPFDLGVLRPEPLRSEPN